MVILEKLILLTGEAGKIAMKYHTEGLNISYKSGDKFDPLTQADREVDAFLRRGVKDILDVPILSEEHEHKELDYSGDVRMIDPINGTKDYIGGSGKFSIMIGLCRFGEPFLGVVYEPYNNVRYYGEKGKGSYKKISYGVPIKITVSKVSSLANAKCVGKGQFSEPRESERLLKKALGIDDLLVGGNSGSILGEISEGSSDVHFFTNPRGGKRDICGPQIILEEAGGVVTDTSGKRIDYSCMGYKIKDGFLASNGFLHAEALRAYESIN